ncbi:hypothetical protein JZU48_00235, partial [bacterium]|nr:hypothetical protein [bacterium]
VVLSVAALGIGIVIEASKFALLRSRRSVVLTRVERRRQELDEALKKAETKEAEAENLQRRLDAVNADRQKTITSKSCTSWARPITAKRRLSPR